MKKTYITFLLIFPLFHCQNANNIEFIKHPVTISFSDFLKTPIKENSEDESIEKNNLIFQGFSISSKTITKPSEKILYKNSDISYYIIQGAIIIGESKKGDVLVRQNEMFVVPRGIEHSLIPADDKPVKIIIHQSLN